MCAEYALRAASLFLSLCAATVGVLVRPKHADSRPPCFTLPEHFEPSAWRGDWVLDRRATETFFAPECPYYGDLNWGAHHAGNLDQDEHRLAFRSHSCQSSSYTSHELRMLLANRTVVFFGDSVSLGMANNLACALWKATVGQQVARHIRAPRDGDDGMERPTEPSRCFMFSEGQIVCWISAAKCANFGYEGAKSRYCADTYLRSLGHAMNGAVDFLGPNDVVVANAGVHFNVDNARDQALLWAEVEGLCANVGLWGEAAPLVVWRENAAQNWERGRFPYSPNKSVVECEVWPDDWLEAAEPWMSEYNPYNLFLEPLLANCAGIRRLPVWLPSAMLGLADRVGKRGDCTHYFGPGSAHGLWNTMLLDVLHNHKTRTYTPTHARTAREQEADGPSYSERWRGILLLLDGVT